MFISMQLNVLDLFDHIEPNKYKYLRYKNIERERELDCLITALSNCKSYEIEFEIKNFYMGINSNRIYEPPDYDINPARNKYLMFEDFMAHIAHCLYLNMGMDSCYYIPKYRNDFKGAFFEQLHIMENSDQAADLVWREYYNTKGLEDNLEY